VRRFNRSKLRDLIEARGYTPTSLAAVVGVTEAAVRKWLDGRAEPGFVVGVEAATALGVSPDELLTAA
jgi:transcriptional regulator with XRE-family HTH domain